MGGSQSSSKPGKTDAVANESDAAIQQCNKTLQYLNTSASMLRVKRKTHLEEAKLAFKQGLKVEAAEHLRKHDLVKSNLAVLLRRQLAVEQQLSLINIERVDKMVTETLVNTSAALHVAHSKAWTNTSSSDSPSSAAVDHVLDANALLDEVRDDQSELDDAFLQMACRDAPDLAETKDDETQYASEFKRLEAMVLDDTVDASPPHACIAPGKLLSVLPDTSHDEAEAALSLPTLPKVPTAAPPSSASSTLSNQFI